MFDFSELAEAIHARYRRPKFDPADFKAVQALRQYREALGDGDTREQRVQAFQRVLTEAADSIQPVLRGTADTELTREAARLYIGLGCRRESIKGAVGAVLGSGKRSAKTVGDDHALEYCYQIAYSLAGNIALKEMELIAAQLPVPSESLLLREPWRKHLGELDETLTALEMLGLTEELSPNDAHWDARSGFLEIREPPTGLITTQARTARKLFGVSPWWDHERDARESELYWDAQVKAVKTGTDVQRVLLYRLSDEDVAKALASADSDQERSDIERRGRAAAIDRAKEQLDGIEEAVRGATGPVGTLTVSVMQETDDLRKRAKARVGAGPLAQSDGGDFYVPSIAVYRYGRQAPKVCAAIHHDRQAQYILSAASSDIDLLSLLYQLVHARAVKVATAPDGSPAPQDDVFADD